MGFAEMAIPRAVMYGYDRPNVMGNIMDGHTAAHCMAGGEQDEEREAVGEDTEKAHIALGIRSVEIMAVEIRCCSVQQWFGSFFVWRVRTHL